MSSWTYQQKNTGENVISSASKNYYELLAVTPGATDREIEEAYHKARSLYGQDSVAFYSLYSGEERGDMLKQLSEAYNTLKDPVRRLVYNTELSSSVSDKQMVESAGDILHLHIDENGPDKREIEKTVNLKKSLSVMGDRDPMAAEQFRILFTRIEQISHRDSYKSFAVTSAVKGEGKTSTSFNLAYLMAHEFKKKVLLLDCDLRNPSVKSYLQDGVSVYGLVDVIKGDVNLDEAIVRLKGSTLYILHSGGHTIKSSEFLSSRRMDKIIGKLKEQYDYLILDSPPIFTLADMNIISKLVDGVILVVRAGETPRDIVLKSANSLPGGKIVGIILNGAETISKKYKYYY